MAKVRVSVDPTVLSDCPRIGLGHSRERCLDEPRVALIFTYGVFWATALSNVGRYRAFDTARLFGTNADRQARARFAVGVLVLNAAPVVWLAFLLETTREPRAGTLGVAFAAFAALSVFGFHRVFHGLVASPSTWPTFYAQEQYDSVRGEPPFEQVESFWAHAIPGVLYVLVPPLPLWAWQVIV